ncbi:MAG: HAMP domain-containing sensor histidine kinase [Eubacteriales bacterium]
MMKKLNLSLQIAIIFLLAFVVTYSSLAYFIVNQLDTVFENSVYEQLESTGKELMTIDDMNQADSNPMFAYISYSSQSNIYSTSDNIDQFISEKHTKLLINKAFAQPNSISRYKNLIDGKSIFYVVLNYESFFGLHKNDVFIVLTDSTLKEEMVRDTSVQLLLACLFAFLLGYLLIYLWAIRLAGDTKKIAKSLQTLDENQYKNPITTTRQDEIGNLVDSIELMRKKIMDNQMQKQEIIQGVSHDLKTPIAIIRSYAEALEDGIYSPEKVANVTLAQCDRINEKIRKLLNVTRIGYLEMNSGTFGSTNICSLIDEMAELYNNKSKIKIAVNTSLCQFYGDTESWRIVIENLLDNAIRYAKTEIVISLSKNMLSVYNDGDPIDESKAAMLFEAYEKGDDGNYGLGLSIVKRTVDLFGYSIKAENIGKGVKFTITKPE